MRARPVVALALLLGAACVRYTPQPVDVAAAPAAYRARTLGDSALLAALDSMGAGPSLPSGPSDTGLAWNTWSLAHAAWVLSPERARLTAEVRVAEAHVDAFGGRPMPGVQGQLERAFSGQDGSSPWALQLAGLFTLELGGKNGARIALAEAGVFTARARADEVAWARLHEARRLLVERLATGREHGAALAVGALVGEVLAATERQYADGAVGRAEVVRARADHDAAIADIGDARRQEEEAAAAAQELFGFAPPVGLGTDVEPLPRCGEEPREVAREAALTRRPEMARVLAEYQEAEGQVRLAAAESWPDLQLGPGLFYDHGVGKWLIGFGSPVLPFNYRGPLREALAARDVAAARVAETQVALLAEVDGALLRCTSARAAEQELQLLARGARAQEQAAQAAVERGEASPVVLLQARLVSARWQQRIASAEHRLALARLALDRAAASWTP